MKLEHVALNVAEPAAVAAWYRDHLGMEIALSLKEPPYTHFLRDTGGTMMLEIYNHPPDQTPRYADMHPSVLHVAFVSENPEADKQRLTAAGASVVQEMPLDDGGRLVTLRDPWGLAIQLVKRSRPLLHM